MYITRRVKLTQETTERLQSVIKVLDDLLVLNKTRECSWGTLQKKFNEQVYHFTVKGFHTYTIEVEFRYDGITLKPKLTEEQGKSKRLLEVEKQHLSVIYCETLFASVFEMAEILERGFENDNRV